MISLMASAESALTGPAEGPPVGRVERRKARTRGALLAAARSLFAGRGVEQTTIAEIADQADVAVGSFYNYFPTKDELLAALLETSLTEQLRALEARQAQVSDPAEMISIAHRHLVGLAQTDPDWAWLLVRLEVPHRIARTVLWESASGDLAAGIAAGRFDVENPQLALFASGGALLAVIHAVLEGEVAIDVASAHAEGVLRSLGISPREAASIAQRPLPDPQATTTA
jgi:AcrR family transcriptional regulator